ncbi:hypothetical protein D3C71_863920 [compost metagenome]
MTNCPQSSDALLYSARIVDFLFLTMKAARESPYPMKKFSVLFLSAFPQASVNDSALAMKVRTYQHEYPVHLTVYFFEKALHQALQIQF